MALERCRHEGRGVHHELDLILDEQLTAVLGAQKERADVLLRGPQLHAEDLLTPERDNVRPFVVIVERDADAALGEGVQHAIGSVADR